MYISHKILNLLEKPLRILTLFLCYPFVGPPMCSPYVDLNILLAGTENANDFDICCLAFLYPAVTPATRVTMQRIYT